MMMMMIMMMIIITVMMINIYKSPNSALGAPTGPSMYIGTNMNT